MEAKTISDVARMGAKARWKGKTKAQKSAHARMMVACREAKKQQAKGN